MEIPLEGRWAFIPMQVGEGNPKKAEMKVGTGFPGHSILNSMCIYLFIYIPFIVDVVVVARSSSV
jgi:hypothetical protein